MGVGSCGIGRGVEVVIGVQGGSGGVWSVEGGIWGGETSGQKENPLMEFGTIAVLFNNIVGIINQVRIMPLSEFRELLFEEVAMLLQKAVEYSFTKGGHLLSLENLTRQQNIYKGLFVKYQNVRHI